MYVRISSKQKLSKVVTALDDYLVSGWAWLEEHSSWELTVPNWIFNVTLSINSWSKNLKGIKSFIDLKQFNVCATLFPYFEKKNTPENFFSSSSFVHCWLYHFTMELWESLSSCKITIWIVLSNLALLTFWGLIILCCEWMSSVL